MTTGADLSVADRLVQVLHHLGIERAHFAAFTLADITEFAQAHQERIASLTLVAIGTAASGIGFGILIVVPLTQRFLDRRFLGNHPLAASSP